MDPPQTLPHSRTYTQSFLSIKQLPGLTLIPKMPFILCIYLSWTLRRCLEPKFGLGSKLWKRLQPQIKSCNSSLFAAAVAPVAVLSNPSVSLKNKWIIFLCNTQVNCFCDYSLPVIMSQLIQPHCHTDIQPKSLTNHISLTLRPEGGQA